jgi:hypothetical protein
MGATGSTIRSFNELKGAKKRGETLIPLLNFHERLRLFQHQTSGEVLILLDEDAENFVEDVTACEFHEIQISRRGKDYFQHLQAVMSFQATSALQDKPFLSETNLLGTFKNENEDAIENSGELKFLPFNETDGITEKLSSNFPKELLRSISSSEHSGGSNTNAASTIFSRNNGAEFGKADKAERATLPPKSPRLPSLPNNVNKTPTSENGTPLSTISGNNHSFRSTPDELAGSVRSPSPRSALLVPHTPPVRGGSQGGSPGPPSASASASVGGTPLTLPPLSRNHSAQLLLDSAGNTKSPNSAPIARQFLTPQQQHQHQHQQRVSPSSAGGGNGGESEPRMVTSSSLSAISAALYTLGGGGGGGGGSVHSGGSPGAGSVGSNAPGSGGPGTRNTTPPTATAAGGTAPAPGSGGGVSVGSAGTGRSPHLSEEGASSFSPGSGSSGSGVAMMMPAPVAVTVPKRSFVPVAYYPANALFPKQQYYHKPFQGGEAAGSYDAKGQSKLLDDAKPIRSTASGGTALSRLSEAAALSSADEKGSTFGQSRAKAVGVGDAAGIGHSRSGGSGGSSDSLAHSGGSASGGVSGGLLGAGSKSSSPTAAVVQSALRGSGGTSAGAAAAGANAAGSFAPCPHCGEIIRGGALSMADPKDANVVGNLSYESHVAYCSVKIDMRKAMTGINDVLLPVRIFFSYHLVVCFLFFWLKFVVLICLCVVFLGNISNWWS